MPKTFRLISVLAFGLVAAPALAEETASDASSLPCNALCRRWMGMAEETASAPQPPVEDRDGPAPPPAARRPESRPAVPRRTQIVTAAPVPPIRIGRDRRTAEARHASAPPMTSYASKPPDAAAPRRSTAPVAVASMEPAVAARPALRVPVPPPTAAEAPTAVPARPVAQVDIVLPLPEQPPPPVVAMPEPRLDVMPPAFDVIAALLLSAPPRR